MVVLGTLSYCAYTDTDIEFLSVYVPHRALSAIALKMSCSKFLLCEKYSRVMGASESVGIIVAIDVTGYRIGGSSKSCFGYEKNSSVASLIRYYMARRV